ncbi:DUF4328 domain-containing protein [Nocardioides marmorisolisilvae]|uniref:DUF4328 domain-containing protein n=1 Tax=Nocardioides marmorisolisilvae TaxID=1542737 RepID=A0A3N0DTM0_9ACTN|nr:DUF4328 domain-containing protein [Nocardioides marmorisolisilvae]RNL78861.1 DUF4328 domain-containing protein [Nocardioides marmorisolisilvae]
MTTTPDSPQPGWYPDPQVPGRIRFWNGAAWTEEHAPVPGPDQPVGYRFALLGQGVRAGLLLSVLIAIGEVGLYAWGLSMFDEAVATGDIDRLSRFDDLHSVLRVSGSIVFVVTGILWVIWQYQLARSAAPGELDRTAGWHLGSWFIPFANLVMPFQNLRDLWRKFVTPASTAIIGWWWAATLATNVFLRVASSGDDPGLDALKAEVSWWLASSVIGIAAAVLALVIINRLTVAGLAKSAAGGRPGPS